MRSLGPPANVLAVERAKAIDLPIPSRRMN
jgi:hypothetical protein